MLDLLNKHYEAAEKAHTERVSKAMIKYQEQLDTAALELTQELNAAGLDFQRAMAGVKGKEPERERS